MSERVGQVTYKICPSCGAAGLIGCLLPVKWYRFGLSPQYREGLACDRCGWTGEKA